MIVLSLAHHSFFILHLNMTTLYIKFNKRSSGYGHVWNSYLFHYLLSVQLLFYQRISDIENTQNPSWSRFRLFDTRRLNVVESHRCKLNIQKNRFKMVDGEKKIQKDYVHGVMYICWFKIAQNVILMQNHVTHGPLA